MAPFGAGPMVHAVSERFCGVLAGLQQAQPPGSAAGLETLIGLLLLLGGNHGLTCIAPLADA